MQRFLLLCHLYVAVLFSVLAGATLAQAQNAPTSPITDPSLNHLQFIGTHNSYHVAPPAKRRQFIETVVKGEGSALDYSHRPLREQLELLGIRQIELDLYGDPCWRAVC